MAWLTSTFIVVDWILWTILIGALVYAMLALIGNRHVTPPSPLSVVLVGFGLLFGAAIGLLLHWLAQSQSFTGLAVLTVLLAWPLSAVATPLFARLARARTAPSTGRQDMAG